MCTIGIASTLNADGKGVEHGIGVPKSVCCLSIGIISIKMPNAISMKCNPENYYINTNSAIFVDKSRLIDCQNFSKDDQSKSGIVEFSGWQNI